MRIPDHLDYSIEEAAFSQYKMRRHFPKEGSADFTVTTSGGDERNFDISQGAYNASKGFLQFTATPSLKTAKFNFYAMGMPAIIDRLQYFNEHNEYVADINFANNAYHVVSMGESVSHFQRAAPEDAGRAGSFICNWGHDIGSQDEDQRPDNDEVIHALEKRYLVAGDSGAADPVLKFRIPLSDFVHSFFSVNKNVYFPQKMTLRIVFAPSTKAVWYSNATATPQTGATATAGSITLSDIELFIPYEENISIVNTLKDKVNSTGLKLLVPWMKTEKNEKTGTSQTVVLDLSRKRYGPRIMRIFHSVYNGTESSNTMYANNNLAGATTVTNFNTYLDGVALQPQAVDCTNFDDYAFLMSNMKGFKESMAGLNTEIYQYTWFWCDDFSSDIYNTNLRQGLPLDSDIHKWTFESTTQSATFKHYTTIIGQMEILITPTAIIREGETSTGPTNL